MTCNYSKKVRVTYDFFFQVSSYGVSVITSHLTFPLVCYSPFPIPEHTPSHKETLLEPPTFKDNNEFKQRRWYMFL